MKDTSQRPDHGYGPLGQAAGGLLADHDMPDVRPLLGLLYNVTADPPGPPSYAVAPTDPEMWDCAPSAYDALDLLTTVSKKGLLLRPPGSLPAPLAPIRVDPRREYRLDGIALAFRAWALGEDTDSGRAVLANVREGYYRPGDVAASAHRRDLFMVNAVDRHGTRIALSKVPGGGEVEDLVVSMQLPAAHSIEVWGSVNEGLVRLLSALRGRRALRRC